MSAEFKKIHILTKKSSVTDWVQKADVKLHTQSNHTNNSQWEQLTGLMSEWNIFPRLKGVAAQHRRRACVRRQQCHTRVCVCVCKSLTLKPMKQKLIKLQWETDRSTIANFASPLSITDEISKNTCKDTEDLNNSINQLT